ncbi:MAG: AraC family transcriptional regulator [Planctomycetia bacterium]
MDGATLSPYPHYSWFAHWLTIRPPIAFEVYEERHVVHRVFLTTAGEAGIAWTTRGATVRFQSSVGDMGFYRCDHATHELAITTTGGYQAYAMSLPDRHLSDTCVAEGMHLGTAIHDIPVFRDAVMHASLLRLAGGDGCRAISEDIGDEIAARQIVMRLCALSGGGVPEWRKDTSVFAPGVMRQIVERVDANLGVHASLEQVSRGFGLSPSHFARKFQQSSGVSLNRFMNRRRIGLSLALLSKRSMSLTQLSLSLGFCSQSHFTRVFSSLTGVTPYQFSRAHRRMEK